MKTPSFHRWNSGTFSHLLFIPRTLCLASYLHFTQLSGRCLTIFPTAVALRRVFSHKCSMCHTWKQCR